MNINEFHAEDIYERWESLCKKANHTIIIITPYLDDLLTQLIVKYQKLPIQIKVYSKIDSENTFDKSYQIKTLLSIVRSQIPLYHIFGLHAKMLIVDWKYISIGSQNFTNRGRKNKETSFISESIDFTNSTIINKVKEWIANAEKIEEEFLIALQEGLQDLEEEKTELKKRFEQEFNSIKSVFEKSKIEKLKSQIYANAIKAKEKFANDEIILNKKIKNNYLRLIPERADLRIWKVSDGKKKILNLKWLNSYPVLDIDSLRMCFLRIASFQITFYDIKYTYDQEIKIGTEKYKCTILFPQNSSTKTNIQFEFQRWRYDEFFVLEKATLNYLFNGLEYKLISENYSDELIKQNIQLNLANDSKKQDLLFSNYLKPINKTKFSHSIETWFLSNTYKFSVIELFRNSIIISEKLK